MMDRIDPEELLWETSTVAEERPAEGAGEVPADVPSGDVLEAYRRGELDPADRERLEDLLAGDPAARRRLLALAGVADETPPPAVRERLLVRFAGSRRRRWPLAVVAAAAVVVAFLGWWLLSPTLPGAGDRAGTVAALAGTGYEVRVEALAQVRSAGAGGEAAAHPRTRVRIFVEPEEAAVAGVELGLYRLRGGRLERLPVGAELSLEAERGAGVFEAAAATLVGSEPGTRELLVAVAPEGRLPAALPAVSPEAAAAALARASGGKVYRRTVTVLPEPVDEESKPRR